MPGRTSRSPGARVIVALGCLLAVPGCAGADEEAAVADFETSLVLKNAAGKESVEFRERESITMTVTLHNRSDVVRTLTLPSSQTHDCIVLSGKDQEVWRWSAGRMFTQVITELRLAPGESRTFTSTWDLTDRTGASLPPGDYRAVGLVPGGAPGLRSGPRVFTIRR